MKKNSIHILLLASLALWFAGLGCKKEDKQTPVVPPKIKNLSTTQGLIGSDVTIMGSNLKSVDKVKLGAEDAAGFDPAANTDSAITVKVPASVKYGDLLITVYHSGVGSDQINFTVVEAPKPPEATGITPANGFPGTEVTVTGNNLGIVTSVTIADKPVSFTATGTTLTFTIPEGLTSGSQTITITSPGGTTTTTFSVSLAPVITSFTPLSAKVGDEVTVTGLRFTNIQAVTLGSINATYTAVDDKTLKFTVPDGATTGKINITTNEGSASSADAFTVEGVEEKLEPVTDESLVFFDFNGTGKDSWWGDVSGDKGGVETADPVPNGGAYFAVHTALNGWTGFFWRNGANNFPGATIGTSISNYVMKFDVNVKDDWTDGEFAWRLKGAEGDFWYKWTPWKATGSYKTNGWITVTVPLSDFTSDAGAHITDLSKIDSDFGVAFNNGASTVNATIDNVRFQHK